MMKITGLSDLFKWENLHNWWLTKYFFAPLYMERYNQVAGIVYRNIFSGKVECLVLHLVW